MVPYSQLTTDIYVFHPQKNKHQQTHSLRTKHMSAPTTCWKEIEMMSTVYVWLRKSAKCMHECLWLCHHPCQLLIHVWPSFRPLHCGNLSTENGMFAHATRECANVAPFTCNPAARDTRVSEPTSCIFTLIFAKVIVLIFHLVTQNISPVCQLAYAIFSCSTYSNRHDEYTRQSGAGEPTPTHPIIAACVIVVLYENWKYAQYNNITLLIHSGVGSIQNLCEYIYICQAELNVEVVNRWGRNIPIQRTLWHRISAHSFTSHRLVWAEQNDFVYVGVRARIKGEYLRFMHVANKNRNCLQCHQNGIAIRPHVEYRKNASWYLNAADLVEL